MKGKGKGKTGCFKCGGSHLIRDCPNQTSSDKGGAKGQGKGEVRRKGYADGSLHQKGSKPASTTSNYRTAGGNGTNVPEESIDARSWLAQGIIEGALQDELSTEGGASASLLNPGSSTQEEQANTGKSSSNKQGGRTAVPQPRSPGGKITFYEELGVPRDADEKLIRTAWKQKALETHPDKCKNDEDRGEYEEKFKHLQEIYETLGFPRSRELYDAVHLREDRIGRILVLMDMNGSLLFKADPQELGTKAFASVLGGRQPDWMHKDKGFYLRPHAREFLDALLKPDCKLAFAIYTSRQLQNAEPQVKGLGNAVARPQLMRELFALYAGDAYSVPDREAGQFKSKRCLRRIWKDRATCARAGVHLDHCNTLNLDSEARKLKDHPENGLVVPAYTADVVREEALSGKKDSALLALRDYLLRLGLECHGDVRDYLRLFPFSSKGELKQRALPGIDQIMADNLATRLHISD